MNAEIEARLRRLETALQRLDEALEIPAEAPLAIDGSIQRFEFCVELLWKALKARLVHDGVETGAPRGAIRAAFAAGLITDESALLAMLDDRNLTSHTYRDALAREIYARLGQHRDAMRAVADRIAP